MNVRRMHVSPASATNFGHGVYNDNGNSMSTLTIGALAGLGAWFGSGTWKVHGASTSTVRIDRIGMKNIHVILGKGGLLVQVGTGVDKTDCSDLMSVLFAFGGDRIPGRARVPASDPNLNLICPVFTLALRDNSGWYYNASNIVFDDVTLSGARQRSIALGLQHGLNVAFGTASGFTTRPGAVNLELFNIENIERPLFPSSRCDTVNSPRDHLSGAAHILQPVVYTQTFGIGDGSYVYNVQDFSIRPQVAPTWYDVWYCPAVRYSDRIAPAGEYVDPQTNTNWWLFYAVSVNTMMAVDIEGVTKYTTLGYFDSFTLTDDDYFNLNAGFTWTTGNPQQAVVSQDSSANMSQSWTATPATDEATAVHLATSGVSTFTWVVEPYTGASSDVSFALQLELRWYSPTAQTNSTSNPLFIEYDGGPAGWITVQTIYNTGNSAIPFNSYTQTAELPILPSPTDGKIRFRLRSTYTNPTGGNRTAAVRNVHVKQYVRTP